MKNIEFLKKLFGPQIEAELKDNPLDPELFELVDSYATERVWMRPGLPLRERSLLTLASQITDQKWDQVEHHMKSFLHLGGTESELKEVCIHLSVYCGFPTMLTAWKTLQTVLESQSKKD